MILIPYNFQLHLSYGGFFLPPRFVPFGGQIFKNNLKKKLKNFICKINLKNDYKVLNDL